MLTHSELAKSLRLMPVQGKRSVLDVCVHSGHCLRHTHTHTHTILMVNSVSSPRAALTLPQKVLSMPTTRKPDSLLKDYSGSGQNTAFGVKSTVRCSHINVATLSPGTRATLSCAPVRVTTVCLDTPPRHEDQFQVLLLEVLTAWNMSTRAPHIKAELSSDYRPPSTDTGSSVPVSLIHVCKHA